MISTDYLFWLTACVYFEARGETAEGKRAIVHTVLNRVDRRKQSIEAVIKERWQFSWYNQVSIEGKKFPAISDWASFLECGRAVNEAMAERENGETLNHADHYFNPSIVLPSWASKMVFVKKVGGHDFYRS